MIMFVVSRTKVFIYYLLCYIVWLALIGVVRVENRELNPLSNDRGGGWTLPEGKTLKEDIFFNLPALVKTKVPLLQQGWAGP